MSHLLYVGVLALCLLGTAPLEIVLRVHVYARWRRLLLALAPTAVVFVVWDLYAIHAGHWTYESRWLTTVTLPGRLPLDELLFFVVIPVCAVLTLEAVRRCRPTWTIGDEPRGDAP